MKRSIFYLSSLLFLVSSVVKAQDTERQLIIGDLLLLTDNFAQPASNGAAYQASAGWFSSATPVDEWKVRVSVHGNALFVPTSKKTFTVSNSQLQALNIQGAQNARVPTAFGTSSDVVFQGEYQGYPFEFQAFEGINRDYVPHAFVQAAVGLPYGTEVTVRAMPEVTIDGVDASTYGIGVKHSLSQYFRYNRPDDFKLAVGLAYTKFKVAYDFTPVDIQIATLDLIDVNADLWMLEAIGSRRYGDFEVFGALGATSSAFDYTMDGTGDAGLKEINTALKTLGDSEVQFKGDIGFNLYFGRFRVSTMATAGKFFNANLGLHFTI